MARFRCTKCGTEFEAETEAGEVTIRCSTGMNDPHESVKAARVDLIDSVAAERERIREELLAEIDVMIENEETCDCATDQVAHAHAAGLLRQVRAHIDGICPE